MWHQRDITLQARPRGCHLITAEVLGALPQLHDVQVGLLNLLLAHPSTLPLCGGSPVLGTWQGIYLCEHRDRGGSRRLTATVWGE